MDNPSTIRNIADKYSGYMTIKELMVELSYSIDDVYVDKFWDSIEKNKWVYVDKQTLECLGFSTVSDNRKSKYRYLDLFSKFQLGKDFKHLNSSGFKALVAQSTLIEISNNTKSHNKTKHILVARCFKETAWWKKKK